MRGRRLVFIALVAAHGLGACRSSDRQQDKGKAQERVDAIAPRIVSNQTSYPVMIYGDGLRSGSRLRYGARSLDTRFLDAHHLTAVIPADLERERHDSLPFVARLELVGPEGRAVAGSLELTIVDDTAFPTPTALAVSRDGRRVFVASPTTDEVWIYSRDGAATTRVTVGDRPVALAIVPSAPSDNGARAPGDELLIVAHEYASELRVLRTVDPGGPQRSIAVPRGAQGLVVDAAHRRVYVSNLIADAVEVVDLDAGTVLRSLPVGVNPRALALTDDNRTLLVANLGSDDVSILDVSDGASAGTSASGSGHERRVQPRPGLPILGGRTAAFSSYVMGGKAPRALAWSRAIGRALVASAGPNIGPNPQRMEISMNGGLTVLDAAAARFERHLSLEAGIPNAIAVDDARALAFAADLSQGRIFAVDLHKLADPRTAATALAGMLRLPAAPTVQSIRRPDELLVSGRAGPELHSEPTALALTDGNRALLVLSRASGAVTEIDVSDASKLRVTRVLDAPAHAMDAERQRRLGETIYNTDLGRSGMSCDGCHIDGHNDGVLFEKTHPLRIYRVTTLRDIAETPPYFFPVRLESLAVTAAQVLGRNRFHNPVPDRREIEALTLYQQLLTAPPDPYLASDGSLPDDLTLPDGAHGSSRRGMTLFEGKAGCATVACHAPPHFSADQSAATRGHGQDVGTPKMLPLHQEWQEAPDRGAAVPSLTGAWDNFPLLASGAGGLEVAGDGAVEPRHPFALRRVLELPGTDAHGATSTLTSDEKNDLLAYLLTL